MSTENQKECDRCEDAKATSKFTLGANYDGSMKSTFEICDDCTRSLGEWFDDPADADLPEFEGVVTGLEPITVDDGRDTITVDEFDPAHDLGIGETVRVWSDGIEVLGPGDERFSTEGDR